VCDFPLERKRKKTKGERVTGMTPLERASVRSEREKRKVRKRFRKMQQRQTALAGRARDKVGRFEKEND